jgi:hypothetical protein
MQSLDARTARLVAAEHFLGKGCTVDRRGVLHQHGEPTDRYKHEIAIMTAIILECVGSEDVEPGITAKMGSPYSGHRKVLNRMADHFTSLFDLCCDFLARRELA